MLIITLMCSIAAGGICGMTAFVADFGLIQSLIVYAAAGQTVLLAVPFIRNRKRNSALIDRVVASMRQTLG